MVNSTHSPFTDERDDLPGLFRATDGNGVYWPIEIGGGQEVWYRARDIRVERTGFHGFLGIALEPGRKPLAHDTFNITRDEERRRLAKSAHGMLPEIARIGYSWETMKQHLDVLCIWIVGNWEESRFQITKFDRNERISPLAFPIKPYIIDGAGTVMFSPPGSGKSLLTQTMAVCVALGRNGLFDIHEPRPALYINLERSARSLAIRERQILEAFAVGENSGVSYIHARGAGLVEVAKRIRRWVNGNPDGVVFLDSVSRIGLGKLIDDDTANRFIDIMNGFEVAWFGIGHPPRSDKGHTYGSVHFDAGQDVGIKMASERRGDTRLVGLEVVKANDIAFPPIKYLAFDFRPDGSGLAGIREATADESAVVLRSLKRPTKGEASSVIEDVLNYLDQANTDRPERTIKEALPQHTPDGIHSALYRSAKMAWIRQTYVVGGSNTWGITEKGRTKLFGDDEVA